MRHKSFSVFAPLPILAVGILTLYHSGCENGGKTGSYPTYRIDGNVITIETSKFSAQIKTEGYTSGVAGGTFVDKETGAKDLGHGLDIVDFLLKPGSPPEDAPEEFQYPLDGYHGNIPKQYIELPQICTQAKKLPYKIVQAKDFIAVKLWYRWEKAAPGYKPGSLWEQYLVFPEGKRYFFSSDIVTSANDVEDLFLRIDLPGHLKHNGGDTFEKIYLSYLGELPASEFLSDFPPDGKFLYQRDMANIPERMIRSYQTKLGGKPGPFLAGMTLDPAIVYEGWCHQRGYVCFIEEIGGVDIKAGGQFSAAYVIGFFDSIDEMNRVYDEYKGWKRIGFSPDFEHAESFEGLKE